MRVCRFGLLPERGGALVEFRTNGSEMNVCSSSDAADRQITCLNCPSTALQLGRALVLNYGAPDEFKRQNEPNMTREFSRIDDLLVEKLVEVKLVFLNPSQG